ncbi:MAG TPA: hypothetical protein GXZ86_06405 [Clostridiales bacterium]|jgi:hypothetical protein|nr:hypothetical protein [Clostridiales bacterium]
MNRHTPAPRQTAPRERRRGLFSLRALALYLLLVALVSVVSLSRYSTTIAGTTTVRVARPAISLTRGDITLNGTPIGNLDDLLQYLLPGDVITCQYTVSNQDAVGISEVKMRYKLIAPSIEPLVFSVDGAEWTELPHSMPQSNEHTVTITFPQESYIAAAGLVGQERILTITLLAEQVNN